MCFVQYLSYVLFRQSQDRFTFEIYIAQTKKSPATRSVLLIVHDLFRINFDLSTCSTKTFLWDTELYMYYGVCIMNSNSISIPVYQEGVTSKDFHIIIIYSVCL